MKIVWACKKCHDKTTSDSSIRWSMDWCDCGESGIDLEEGYCRQIGPVEVLERIYDVKFGLNKEQKMKVKEAGFKVPFAFDDGILVDIKDAEKGVIYTCACGSDVSVRG